MAKEFVPLLVVLRPQALLGALKDYDSNSARLKSGATYREVDRFESVKIDLNTA